MPKSSTQKSNRTSMGRAKECRGRMCVHTYIVECVTHLSIVSMFHMPRTNYVGILIIVTALI
ncbi:uncharacterized protein Dvir_GJ26542 [Drosophila virilis]|uniref:Uncharacterized protein n=1 Tax=Drosophila virilis TaxID=7244 RepID=A0A0Q9WD05_DROVI|nr:uncharacterized protein Dvir_GJ26542 [Drosophila virilis]